MPKLSAGSSPGFVEVGSVDFTTAADKVVGGCAFAWPGLVRNPVAHHNAIRNRKTTPTEKLSGVCRNRDFDQDVWGFGSRSAVLARLGRAGFELINSAGTVYPRQADEQEDLRCADVVISYTEFRIRCLFRSAVGI